MDAWVTLASVATVPGLRSVALEPGWLLLERGSKERLVYPPARAASATWSGFWIWVNRQRVAGRFLHARSRSFVRAAAGSARALAADTIGRHRNGIAGSLKAQGLILVSWDALLGAGGVAGTCTALYEAMAAILGHRRPHHQASSSNPTKAKHQPPFSLQALGLMRCDDSRSQQCATIRSRVD